MREWCIERHIDTLDHAFHGGHVADRALIREAADELDARRSAAQIISITRTFVAEAVGRVVDRSLQVCGAPGVSEDVPLALFLREVRPFRIYDGPSETHRWAIARRVLRNAREGSAHV